MKKIISLLLILAFATTGCSFSSHAKNFSGLSTPDGKAIEHLSKTNIAIHFLFSKPILGDATLAKTVEDFTSDAKVNGASKVRIVQSKVTSLWFLMPPFTIFLTPTITNVAGDTL